MKYREVKTKLEQSGFNFDAWQSDSYLPMFMFIHPNIDGSINICFNDNNIPDDFKMVDSIDLNDDRILDIDIIYIDFNIDKSISFMNDDLLDINGSSNMNRIILQKDLSKFEQILDIIVNPLASLDFSEYYFKKWNDFTIKVKALISTIDKKYIFNTFKTSGDENCLYSNICAELKFDCVINDIKVKNHFFIQFQFNVFSDDIITIGNYFDHKNYPIDINIDDFKKLICI